MSDTIKVLDDGFVKLINISSDESIVAHAARLTSGSTSKDNTGLIRYLMRHNHGTPLEFTSIVLHLRMPIYVKNQWERHRTWDYMSFNEYSMRYSEAIDSAEKTQPDAWRLQAAGNRQGSDGHVTEWPEGYSPHAKGVDVGGDRDVGLEPDLYPMHETDDNKLLGTDCPISALGVARAPTAGEYLTQREFDLQYLSKRTYAERIGFGVAREQARKDLPLSTYTELWAEVDLRNMVEFLALRMDPHAQQEIREYATVIGEQIIKPNFPIVWQAFCDYRLHAITLTALDIAELRYLLENDIAVYSVPARADHWANKREHEEFAAKLELLGIAVTRCYP